MNRTLYPRLVEWSKTATRKPLLLRGARQVGKSWLIRKLGASFKSFVEINFEEQPEIGKFFEGNLDPEQLVSLLSNYLGKQIIPGETLLFLDEIQACPRAITSLRYFYEKCPALHVIGAGSLIESELQKVSTPVGRVSFLYLYPLSFEEFLMAMGRHDLNDFLDENAQAPLSSPLHELLLGFVRDYTLVGGMPAVVDEFIRTRNMDNCQRMQGDLIETYRADFAKYATRSQIKYLDKVFDAVPVQGGRKFKYSNVSREVKSRDLATALDLLVMAGVVHKVLHTNANGLPLGAEANPTRFKTLIFDLGISQRLMGLDIKPLFLDPDITTINRGALAESFVGLELIAHGNPCEKGQIHYWHREARASNAEVDYIIARNGKIIPLDVKSGSEGRMYSLQLFMNEKKVAHGYRLSKHNYSEFNNISTIPFYAIGPFLRRMDRTTPECERTS